MASHHLLARYGNRESEQTVQTRHMMHKQNMCFALHVHSYSLHAFQFLRSIQTSDNQTTTCNFDESKHSTIKQRHATSYVCKLASNNEQQPRDESKHLTIKQWHATLIVPATLRWIKTFDYQTMTNHSATPLAIRHQEYINQSWWRCLLACLRACLLACLLACVLAHLLGVAWLIKSSPLD